ncbi:hypothetical protein D3C80_1802060 [compost metagenome]
MPHAQERLDHGKAEAEQYADQVQADYPFSADQHPAVDWTWTINRLDGRPQSRRTEQ